jgi:hypothetical protein
VEEVHVAAQVMPGMPESAAGVLAQEEPREEDHGDDEHDAGNDADPGQ